MEKNKVLKVLGCGVLALSMTACENTENLEALIDSENAEIRYYMQTQETRIAAKYINENPSSTNDEIRLFVKNSKALQLEEKFVKLLDKSPSKEDVAVLVKEGLVLDANKILDITRDYLKKDGIVDRSGYYAIIENVSNSKDLLPALIFARKQKGELHYVRNDTPIKYSNVIFALENRLEEMLGEQVKNNNYRDASNTLNMIYPFVNQRN